MYYISTSPSPDRSDERNLERNAFGGDDLPDKCSGSHISDVPKSRLIPLSPGTVGPLEVADTRAQHG